MFSWGMEIRSHWIHRVQDPRKRYPLNRHGRLEPGLAEIDTSICNDASAELFQGGYRSKRNDPIFQHLRNIMSKPFKRNMNRSFAHYMVEAYGTSRCVWHLEIRKEGERDLKAVLEYLEQVSKSKFWIWDNGSRILFWR